MFIWGFGGMIPAVNFVCFAISYHDLSSTGSTRWDRGKFRVVHDRIRPGRCTAIVLGLLVLLFLSVLKHALD